MELLTLVLNCGMSSDDLASTLEKLREQSKSIGSHKKRSALWDCYTKMASKANNLADGTFCFFKYSTDTSKDDTEGDVEVVELTKRQKGMVNGGGVELMGPRFKPPEDPSSKTVAYAWMEGAAQTAWDDLMHGEPCIYITPSPCGSVPGTSAPCARRPGRRSRRLRMSKSWWRSSSRIAAPLRLFPRKRAARRERVQHLPRGFVQARRTVADDDRFGQHDVHQRDVRLLPQRKNMSNIDEANKLISQMLADVGKGLTPLICASSTKEASVAYKSALMKKIYLHESMKKFIAKAKEDGQVEVCVIKGEDESKMGAFAQYGKLVFEMFYRCDLTTMGA